MTTYTVTSGQTSSGTTLNGGDVLNVSAGGVADFSVVNSGGSLNVYSSGETISAALNGGNESLSGGDAFGTVVTGKGTVTVYAGGVAISAAVGSAGAVTVSSGGVADGTVVGIGAIETVSSGGAASGTTVNSGGTETIYAGGVASGTVLNSGNQNVYSGGVASGTNIAPGGSEFVSSGGVVEATEMTGGSDYVSFGGVAISTVLGGTFTYESLGGPGIRIYRIVVETTGLQQVESGGVASGTTVGVAGVETVYSGGLANGTVVTGGGQLTVSSGGVADGTLVIGGQTYTNGGGSESVSAGGTANGTVVSSGGTESVYSGGVATGTVVSSGGTQAVSGGLATRAIVSSGGAEFVYSGGVATGTVVSSGGTQAVSGGLATRAIVSSGGTEFVYSGGVATGTVVNGGGTEVVLAGVATGTVVSGGGSEIVLAGVATGTVVGSGATEVVSGGVASGTVVNSGGTQVVSGGVASGTFVNGGGKLTALSGGVASAAIVSSGGELIVFSSGVAGGVVVYGGGSIDFPDLVYSSGGLAVLNSQTNVLTVVEGGSSRQLQLLRNYIFSGEAFQASVDSGGGTLVVVVGGATPVATVTSVVASPSTGNVATGALVTVTLSMSEAVTVLDGTPTLTLNDGGTATYDAARSSGAALVFDYTVQSGQSTASLAVTGLNLNGATIQDATGNSASLTAALATFSGLEVNAASSANISAAYTAILRAQPAPTLVSQTVAQINAGQTTLTQFENGLIGSEQGVWSTLPALVTIDACYDATSQSSLLTVVATSTGSPAQVGGFYAADYLHNFGYSDSNVWTIMGSEWGADAGSNFYSLYNGFGNNYSAFISTVYQREYGSAPTAASLQVLLNDVPGVAALLSGGTGAATPIQVMGGLYGYLLYVGQIYNIGQYGTGADAFLQAAANGTAIYGPDLAIQFPSNLTVASAATAQANPNTTSFTVSDSASNVTASITALQADTKLTAVSVTGTAGGDTVNLTGLIVPATISLGGNTASASAGLSAPNLSFIGTPDAITLGNGAATINYYATQPTSGIETIANFQYGLDQLIINFTGSANSTLQAYDVTVSGVHAIALAVTTDPTHGVVLTGMAASQTAADLLAHHLTVSAQAVSIT